MADDAPEVVRRLKPRRAITGMSAILLPFRDDGDVDRDGFVGHLRRTVDAGLVPAVNMDTGYGSLIGPVLRREIVDLTRAELGGAEFVAGAYIDDEPGAVLDVDAYARELDDLRVAGALPVVFPSFGLASVPDGDLGEVFSTFGARCDRFLAFELSPVFHPAGRVFSLETYRAVLDVASCVGAKHSSLDRRAEWERLDVRDACRPDFMVLTGNDLAIDMVMYGSDYLLGLSTFAPEAFARRDRYWASGDGRFYEIDDLLQYLGFFAFRDPVPGYKHDAAMLLHDSGRIASAATHPASPERPESDLEVLRDIAARLEVMVA